MSQSTSKPSPSVSGRQRIKKLGTIYDDAIPIVLHEHAFEEIVEFSHQETGREIGGFLIGGLLEADRQYVEVQHFLPAVDTRSRAASLTFTHDTWATMNRTIEKKFPGESVVGWHHTHPGLGIFLSEYDLFIHKHYFSASWHVALVVDPQVQDLGFFQWRGHEIVDCGFFLIYNDPESKSNRG